MIGNTKNQQAILQKLGVEHLNEMQLAAQEEITKNKDVVLLSPTGTGKTIAFLLPIISLLNPEKEDIQALILVPSRELAIQIEQVVREMGSGYKANAVYGGRAGAKDKQDLKHAPTILIGTPGRVADHIRRENIITDSINFLVLDEFDKSLEVGFEKEMKEIIGGLHNIKKRVLTSATKKAEVPGFVGLKNPKQLNYLSDVKPNLTLKIVTSNASNKLETLENLLGELGNGNGILFCNLKESITEVSTFLHEKNIKHGCFYGGLEQKDRERALIKFRNGTFKILLATDLAARGIDVPEMDYIIHYQLPFKKEEFTHRNGRTARMNSNGSAFILNGKLDKMPYYVTEEKGIEEITVNVKKKFTPSKWTTLYISGGRKDKISKGDIAGLFFKQGGLKKDELGNIELMQDCAFVAVPAHKQNELVAVLNNTRLKSKKVRISLLE